MILCPKCLTANSDDAKYCYKCGCSLSEVDDLNVQDETRNVLNEIDFGPRVSSEQLSGLAHSSMGGSASSVSRRTDTVYVPSSGGSHSGSFSPDRDIQPSASPNVKNDDKSRVFTSKAGIVSLALSVASIVIAASCMIMLIAFPKAPSDLYQPDRSENSKTDVLQVDLNDRTSTYNMPGCVRTEDVSKIKNMPSSVKAGGFYALWDCDVLSMEGNGKTHMLVTMREMYPEPGRVWMNWYNWTKWTGWKAYTPS